MAVTKFSNINQLTVYLDGLEKRLDKLEYENEHLREELDVVNTENQSLRERIDQAGSQERPGALPNTGLLSHSFLTRAFAVWGHYFVAQLLIGLGIGVLYLILMLVMVVVFSSR